jgi:magnesium transporter
MSKMQENSTDEKDILVTDADETREEYHALGVEEIRELLNKGQYTKLRQLMQELNDADVADYLEEMDESEVVKIFRILPKDMAADVFSCLEIDQQQSVITSLSDKDAARILDNMMSDDAKELMEEMPANVVKRLIANTSPDTRHAINHLMRYPEDSAGSIMTVEYVDLKEHQTVAEAIERIRKVGVDSETINICYVLDNKRTLVGTVALRYLLLSEPDAVIGDIMHKNVVSLHTLMDQEEVARQFKKYDFTAMPVVDNEDRLVGIITVDDVVDILEEETTEDIEKMAALTPSDKPYLKTSIFETFKKRIPWLLLLMISATFTGGIITSFEDALSRYVVLTAYIPMLMDTGGNAGGQASATIIRGLSLDEVTFKDWPVVMWREIRTAVLCGAALSLCNFAKLMLFDRVGVSVAFVVCVTLLLAVVVAKIVGSMLPILAKKIGMDPAVMASPFITTIVDAISLLIYFRVATLVLGI